LVFRWFWNHQQALATAAARQESLEDAADAGAVASMIYAGDVDLEFDEE
jgi:hypothetical protein